MFDQYAAGQTDLLVPNSSMITTENSWQNVVSDAILAAQKAFIATQQQGGGWTPTQTAAGTIAQPTTERKWLPWALGLGFVGIVFVLAKR
jgi:hypothetical protein